jgi:hypothetical protein
MATNVEIPTEWGHPFSVRVTLLDVTYTRHFRWNTIALAWTVDVYDETDRQPILLGVPLVTGCDLLEQFAYLPLGARTIWTVMTVGPGLPPDEVPTFQNLGLDGHLFATMP